MPAKRYSVEQIVAKLREAEKLQAQGATIAQVSLRWAVAARRGRRPATSHVRRIEEADGRMAIHLSKEGPAGDPRLVGHEITAGPRVP